MRNHMRAGRATAIAAAMMLALLAPAACAPDGSPLVPLLPSLPTTGEPQAPSPSYYLPQRGTWDLPANAPTGRIPSALGTVTIEGLGIFTFNPLEVETTRPDIFAIGHLSVFDVVAHLGSQDWFPVSYHYDAALDTHVIDALDGRANWWYRAHYAGGWSEINTFRMDMYPYQDGMTIQLNTQSDEYMGRLHDSFAQELLRKSVNRGRVVIPEVRIGTVVHTNVPVSAHDMRTDVIAPGTVTALDVLLSLADQKKLQRLKLTWYSTVDDARSVDSYRVEQIDDGDGIYDRESSADTGEWVYETGSLEFSGFKGSHVHIPADVRVIVSPEYMTWYWLGSEA
jgi:hypothetical protein